MIKVYAWLPKSSNIGHASMDIAFGEARADYVSWWPRPSVPSTGATMAKDVAKAISGAGIIGAFNTYPDDVSSEGGNPDRTVEISCLEETRMLAAWSVLKKSGRYQFLFNNCATSVASILEAGGANLTNSAIK